MELRWYQKAAVEQTWDFIARDSGNPAIVIPTGGGKTPVLSQIAGDVVRWGGRCLILAHVQELVGQAANTLRTMLPQTPVGIYAAGLGARDTGYAITCAQIQSIYQRAFDIGRFDIVLVDEAHLIPFEGDGMYRSFLSDVHLVNPNARTIGLTATPYRLKGGMIVGDHAMFDKISFEVGVRQLIDEGFLCPLISKAGVARADLSHVQIRAGEFVGSQMEGAMSAGDLVAAAVDEIIAMTADRKAVLIFTAGEDHGAAVVEQFAARGIECGWVSGRTPAAERDSILARYQRQEFKYLANINVLTTGFDARHIDAVVLLRPTMSPGLYYQMIGRGFRLHPDKKNCLVLDYAGNIERHGPVDQIEVGPRRAGAGAKGEPVAKTCPKCLSVILAGLRSCPDCGHAFPDTAATKHQETAYAGPVVSTDPPEQTRWTLPVVSVSYFLHTKRDAAPGTPQTMRVEYEYDFNLYASEWVCPEHSGFARQKFESWWRARSHDPIPRTARDAVLMAEEGSLAVPAEVTIEKLRGEKYPKVIGTRVAPSAIPPKRYDASPAAIASLEHSHATRAPDESGTIGGIPIDDIPF